MTRILVLGSNFSGIDAALKLKKKIKDEKITVVDKDKTTEFYPAMYEIISGKKKVIDLEIDLEELYRKRGIMFVNDEIKGIDNRNKKVMVSKSSIDYDYLVVALGNISNYYGIKGAQEYTLPFKSIENALKIRIELERLVKDKSNFNIIVVGSGLTGVELIFEIREYLNKAAKQKKAMLTLIEAKDTPCPWANEKSREYLEELFKKDSITVRTGFAIKEVSRDTIISCKDEVLKSDLVIWCAGIKPVPAIDAMSIERDTGGIKVDDYLRSASDPSIYACGDIVSKKMEDGFMLPKTAHFAMAEADIISENISNKLKGEILKKYSHENNPPLLVDVGRHGAFLMTRKSIAKSPGWFWHTLKNIIEKWWILSRKYG